MVIKYYMIFPEKNLEMRLLYELIYCLIRSSWNRHLNGIFKIVKNSRCIDIKRLSLYSIIQKLSPGCFFDLRREGEQVQSQVRRFASNVGRKWMDSAARSIRMVSVVLQVLSGNPAILGLWVAISLGSSNIG